MYIPFKSSLIIFIIFGMTYLAKIGELTLKGYIVTMPMVFIHSDNEDISDVQKDYLDEIHIS